MKSDKYTLKIPKETKELIEKYINIKPSLGFKTVSQYISFLIQTDVKRIFSEVPDLDDYVLVESKSERTTYVLHSKLDEYKQGKLKGNTQTLTLQLDDTKKKKKDS